MKEVIRRVKRNYRMIVSNIKRILYYLPLIWGIREWDHTYTMKVYVHQLKYQSKYLAHKYILEEGGYWWD